MRSPLPRSLHMGGIVLGETGEPLAGAKVTVADARGAAQTATTDSRGAFRFDRLAPGQYHIEVALAGLAPFASDEEVTAGNLTEVTYRPRAEATEVDGAPQDVEVIGERPPREVRVVRSSNARLESSRAPTVTRCALSRACLV